jgi:hypothetical protein
MINVENLKSFPINKLTRKRIDGHEYVLRIKHTEEERSLSLMVDDVKSLVYTKALGPKLNYLFDLVELGKTEEVKVYIYNGKINFTPKESNWTKNDETWVKSSIDPDMSNVPVLEDSTEDLIRIPLDGDLQDEVVTSTKEELIESLTDAPDGLLDEKDVMKLRHLIEVTKQYPESDEEYDSPNESKNTTEFDKSEEGDESTVFCNKHQLTLEIDLHDLASDGVFSTIGSFFALYPLLIPNSLIATSLFSILMTFFFPDSKDGLWICSSLLFALAILASASANWFLTKLVRMIGLEWVKEAVCNIKLTNKVHAIEASSSSTVFEDMYFNTGLFLDSAKVLDEKGKESIRFNVMEFLREEVYELGEAKTNADKLDAISDILAILVNYMKAHELPISVLNKYAEAVSQSNLSKLTTDLDLANKTVEAYANGTHPDKLDQLIGTYVCENEGIYSVKRSDNNKIMKCLGYKTPMEIISQIGSDFDANAAI